MKKSEFLVALEDILQTEDAIDENLNSLGELKTVSDLVKLAGDNISD